MRNISKQDYKIILKKLLNEQQSNVVSFKNIRYTLDSIRFTDTPGVIVVRDTNSNQDYGIKVDSYGNPIGWFTGDPNTVKIGPYRNKPTQFQSITYYPNSIRSTNIKNIIVVKDINTGRDYAIKVDSAGNPIDWFRGDPTQVTILGNLDKINQIKAQACNGKGYPSIYQIITKLVTSLEGGYYHPEMLRGNSQYSRVNDGRFRGSGETFLGIDRLNGGKDLEAMPEWSKFWSLIDADKEIKKYSKPKTMWKKHDYSLEDNPTLFKQLAELSVNMMRKRTENFGTDTLSAQAKKIIACDARLILHFVYGAYNGQGHYNDMAREVNRVVRNGGNANDCLVALNNFRVGHRLSLLRQTGEKIKSIINSGVLNKLEGTWVPIFKL